MSTDVRSSRPDQLDDVSVPSESGFVGMFRRRRIERATSMSFWDDKSFRGIDVVLATRHSTTRLIALPTQIAWYRTPTFWFCNQKIVYAFQAAFNRYGVRVPEYEK